MDGAWTARMGCAHVSVCRVVRLVCVLGGRGLIWTRRGVVVGCTVLCVWLMGGGSDMHAYICVVGAACRLLFGGSTLTLTPTRTDQTACFKPAD